MKRKSEILSATNLYKPQVCEERKDTEDIKYLGIASFERT